MQILGHFDSLQMRLTIATQNCHFFNVCVRKEVSIASGADNVPQQIHSHQDLAIKRTPKRRISVTPSCSSEDVPGLF